MSIFRILFFLFIFFPVQTIYGGEELELILDKLKKENIEIEENNSEKLPIYTVKKFNDELRNHFEERDGGEINYLVMHNTEGKFIPTMNWFTLDSSEVRVSAHYVITEQEKENQISGGFIFQVVPEAKRARHAGVSYWNGVENLNNASIGIENVSGSYINLNNNTLWIVNDSKQIKSLGILSEQVVKKHKIKPINVVGHSDIAPDRKQDPGIFFPWKKLYEEHNVGAWLAGKEENPEYISRNFNPNEKLPQGVSDSFFLTQLKKYGYKIKDTDYNTSENQEVVKAFKSHFSQNQKPSAYNGKITEKEMLWIWGLVAKYHTEQKQQ